MTWRETITEMNMTHGTSVIYASDEFRMSDPASAALPLDGIRAMLARRADKE